MQAGRQRTRPRLTALAATCGALAGVGGITHGIGEMLQGSHPPEAIVFDSWAQGPIADNLGGEPAMSLIPNLRVTGIVTIAVSLVVVVWSLSFLRRRHAGTVLVLLSVAMLAVGGGFGPPIVGMLAGLVAGAAHATRPRRVWRLVNTHMDTFRRLWPALFWLCAVNAVFLVVGSLLIGGVLGLAAPEVFVVSLFLVVPAMPLAALAGRASQNTVASSRPSGPPALRP